MMDSMGYDVIMSNGRSPEGSLPGPGEQGYTPIVAGVVDVVVMAPASTGEYPDRWRVLCLRRASGTRCTGAWEIVHGSIEPGERPADAACREVLEETGFVVEQLYHLGVNPFFMPVTDTVQLALVFAAVVSAVVDERTVAQNQVQFSQEHDAAMWMTAMDAQKVLAWPREHEAVRYAMWLLRTGDAGSVSDVLLAPGIATSVSRQRPSI